MNRRFVLAAALSLAALAPASANPFFQTVMLDPDTREPLVSRPHATPSAQAPAIPREIVAYSGAHAPGTVVVNTAERRLYYVLGGGQAVRYGIGVGRPGFEWGGSQTITRKQEWPDWRPPVQMLQRRPDLPRFMAGGPDNPLGARAMYLGSSLYRIHGSNEPHTIGQAVSSGCIRMLNDDVVDLYNRVRVGTRVVVLR
jgi:lipoprotein-anchoring transpeptidase ErfK/SrfK